MHEYSLVRSLLAQVGATARAHGATGVRRVRVRIGELAGVDPRLFATAYETCRPATVCARASLELEVVPAGWVCGACGAGIAGGDALRCAACGGAARLAGGDEIVLEQIDLEVA